LNPAIATTAFVLDNSVLCGWILATQATPYSDAVAGLLPLVDAHAPWLLQLEFTNVLRTACRRGTLPVAAACEIIDQVALLPIRIDSAPSPAGRPAEPGFALSAQQL
jgi:hypothetical protein